MSSDSIPWSSSELEAEDTHLVHLAPEVTGALARGDLETASAVSTTVLTPFLVSPECRGVWHDKDGGAVTASGTTDWAPRLLWDFGSERAVGWAGFRAPPDPTGTVDIGFAVDPGHRRKGYGRAALVILLEKANELPDVRTVRIRTRIDNVACRHLVAESGFTLADRRDDQNEQILVLERAVQYWESHPASEGGTDHTTVDVVEGAPVVPAGYPEPDGLTPATAVPSLRRRVTAFIRNFGGRRPTVPAGSGAGLHRGPRSPGNRRNGE